VQNNILFKYYFINFFLVVFSPSQDILILKRICVRADSDQPNAGLLPVCYATRDADRQEHANLAPNGKQSRDCDVTQLETVRALKGAPTGISHKADFLFQSFSKLATN
jgi:hypothetical protein